MTTEPADLDDVPSVLRFLFRELSREGGYVSSGANWIGFFSDNACIEAELKQGESHVLHIVATLVGGENASATEVDVQEWLRKQPQPELGRLSIVASETPEGVGCLVPMLRFEVRIDSLVPEFIKQSIATFAEAWDLGVIAVVTPLEFPLGGFEPYRQFPQELAANNAWLLVSDEVSYPSPDAIAEMRADGAAGIYDTMWSAPRDGELGDLVLVYFTSPKDAACFVARLASRPFQRSDVEANALLPLDPYQWWAYLTELIEIKPIAYKTLPQSRNRYLSLKGGSGHHLSPETIRALSFDAVSPERQSELDQLVQSPVGMEGWSHGVGATLEKWRQTAGGPLWREAEVSDQIIWPLVDLLLQVPASDTETRFQPSLGPMLTPKYPVRDGFVDFVFEYGLERVPVLAIEARLSLEGPVAGLWHGSPDFRQLTRHMAALQVPGLLVDAQRLLLVKPGADTPFAEIVRAEATWSDIAQIRDLMLEVRNSNQEPTIPLSPGTRRVAYRG